MIATGLTFLFGFFVALLFALLLSPLLWHRSRRVARREFEATIPTSANEIRASFDHVRAEAAMSARTREMKALAIEEKAAGERAEAGRVTRENAALREKNRELEDAVARQNRDLDESVAALDLREQEFGQLDGELRETRHDLDLRTEEMDALAARFRDLSKIADERRLTIVTLEGNAERLSDDLRGEERRSRDRQASLERLRSEINALEGAMQKEKSASQRRETKILALTAQLADRDDQISHLSPDGESSQEEATRPKNPKAAPSPAVILDETKSNESASSSNIASRLKERFDASEIAIDLDGLDEAAVRERVADIAARVIHLTALAEGPDSPIDAILSPSQDDVADNKGNARATLAGRVRALRETRVTAQEDEAAE